MLSPIARELDSSEGLFGLVGSGPSLLTTSERQRMARVVPEGLERT